MATRHPGSRSRLTTALTTAVLVPAAAAALAACGSTRPQVPSSLNATPIPVPTAPAAGSQSITETGSSVMTPLFALWAPAYHAQYPQVTLSTVDSSSVGGISAASSGAAIIGASDNAIPMPDPAQKAAFAAARKLRNIAVAVSALAVVYNVPGSNSGGHLKLNGTTLAKIYDGKIKTWNARPIAALNPGVRLPGTGIVPVRDTPDADSTGLLLSYMRAQDPAGKDPWMTASWAKQAGAMAASGSGQMVSDVTGTTGAIGYLPVSDIPEAAAGRLGVAALRNPARHYVVPNATDIDAAATALAPGTPATETLSLVDGPGAQSYPVINYEYAIVRAKQQNAAAARDVQSFLYWAITGGTAQLPQTGFEPLPPSIVTLSQNQIAHIKG